MPEASDSIDRGTNHGGRGALQPDPFGGRRSHVQSLEKSLLRCVRGIQEEFSRAGPGLREEARGCR